MTTLQTLFSEPFFQALGWTLLHFIWQGALVGILFAGVSVLVKHCSSNVRYAAACSSMLLMLVLPVATFYIISTSAQGVHVNQQTQAGTSLGVAPLRTSATLSHWQVNAPAEVDPDALLPPEA
ncbi:MAG TPA: hypothetical protein VF766_14170, partial [Pyrinomonadaceae bacterium]